MHFHVVDAYQDTGSILHRLDARLKVVLAFCLILIIGLTPMGAFGAYMGYFAIMMLGAVLARVDPLVVVRRSLVALPFAGAAITLIFTVPGPLLASVPLVGWPISTTGVIRFVSIIFKSMVSVQAAVLLMLTTHFTDMLWALSALHVPKILVAIISFMYRYLFVLVDEAMRLTRARDSRSAVLNNRAANTRSLIFGIKTTGRMIGNLFVRSFARSERVYQAMVARGYRGDLRQFAPPALQLRDLSITLMTVAAALMILAVSIILR